VYFYALKNQYFVFCMRKYIPLVLFLSICSSACFASSRYWVFFKDKKGTTFNPSAYFDSRVLQRNKGLNLSSDSTDFPVSNKYIDGVKTLVSKVGYASRWLNAVTVEASDSKLKQIEKLPFVAGIQPVMLAAKTMSTNYETDLNDEDISLLKEQTQSMQRDSFALRGFDGHGIRIAVFDAGFPGVNTSPVFEHLRSSGRIIDTWDFVRNKPDVYSHNEHGTMVLSCIAGLADGKPMGMATGAEFLLARTEQESEPFSEEENWLAAVEWAHKHGADIISSSLGYTYQRYFPEQMDGKTSLVARAANIAASKGMLVVNAMGNDGDNSWKYLSTPADADSILSIGGLDPENFLRIDFSSYGPTADFRRKPNVSAFAKVVVASPKKLTVSYGTSFSTPLITGFAACVLQATKIKDPMKLLHVVESAGHLYPYFDYSHGYGLPQASKVLNDNYKTRPTFKFTVMNDTVNLIVLSHEGYEGPGKGMLYFHFRNDKGVITHYSVVRMNDANLYQFEASEFEGSNVISAWYNGYTTELDVRSVHKSEAEGQPL